MFRTSAKLEAVVLFDGFVGDVDGHNGRQRDGTLGLQCVCVCWVSMRFFFGCRRYVAPHRRISGRFAI